MPPFISSEGAGENAEGLRFFGHARDPACHGARGLQAQYRFRAAIVRRFIPERPNP